jgi:hypothetical protein
LRKLVGLAGEVRALVGYADDGAKPAPTPKHPRGRSRDTKPRSKLSRYRKARVVEVFSDEDEDEDEGEGEGAPPMEVAALDRAHGARAHLAHKRPSESILEDGALLEP